MIKLEIIVDLGSKTDNNNNNSSPKLTCLHNSLLIIIVDTPENNLSNVDRKSDIRKIRTSSV